MIKEYILIWNTQYKQMKYKTIIGKKSVIPIPQILHSSPSAASGGEDVWSSQGRAALHDHPLRHPRRHPPLHHPLRPAPPSRHGVLHRRLCHRPLLLLLLHPGRCSAEAHGHHPDFWQEATSSSLHLPPCLPLQLPPCPRLPSLLLPAHGVGERGTPLIRGGDHVVDILAVK